MLPSSLHRKIISGEAGLWATPLRILLRIAAAAYFVGVNSRNKKFDRGEGITRAKVPVISVGNITVGGTGKTPMVIDLVQRLERPEQEIAVIARGYKAQKGRPGDEELLIRRRAPGATYIANPNRAQGAAEAIRTGADVIVLDDGFQHRALARDLDIVLIDATSPFGFDYVLPRGLLREPVQGLQRADVIIVTRCDSATQEVLADIHARLTELADGCPVLSCSHKPSAISQADGTTLSNKPRAFLQGKKVFAFSGLASPHAFEQTITSLGATIIASRRYPDHHSYTAGEIRSLINDENSRDVDLFVTSEKDAVKIANLKGIDLDRIVAVNVSIDFTDEDGTMLGELLDRALRQSMQQ